MIWFDRFGHLLARHLTQPLSNGDQLTTNSHAELEATLLPGDVLLVEGTSRISTAIKYLTQSTWSHAALFIGDALYRHGPAPQALADHTAAVEGRGSDRQGSPDVKPVLVEADVNAGVRAVGLKRYSKLHTRICRPVGLSPADLERVIGYAVSRIGLRYDLKNIIDLARYFFPTPPVPRRWRRQLLALGSGDPTRAICTSLIAQAFQAVRYPILPRIIVDKSADPACHKCYREILHIRHHSLFAPRDFDVSPYFQIVKPTIEQGFDPTRLEWAEDSPSPPAPLA